MNGVWFFNRLHPATFTVIPDRAVVKRSDDTVRDHILFDKGLEGRMQLPEAIKERFDDGNTASSLVSVDVTSVTKGP